MVSSQTSGAAVIGVNPSQGQRARLVPGDAQTALQRRPRSWDIWSGLAAAPPEPTPAQQQSLERARLMLGRVGGVVPRETPFFDWSTVPTDERIVYVMDGLIHQSGFSVNAAAGIVGNLLAESGVLPSRIEGSAAATPMRSTGFDGNTRNFTPADIMNRNSSAGVGPRLPGIGLAQWTSGARRSGLFAQSGAAVLFDMDAQVDYLVGEIQGRANLNATLTANGITVNDAADEVVYNFEIPGAILDGNGNKRPRTDPAVQTVFGVRRANAQRAFNAYQAAQVAVPAAPP